MADLTTQFLDLPVKNPVMNAAGVWCSVASQLEALAESAAGAMVTKSCTLQPRDGNPEPRYRVLDGDKPFGSINSMGLPNEGFAYYLRYAQRHDYEEKPLFVSLSGLTLDDNLTMIDSLKDAVTPAILEVNLSCPNVPGKSQIGYDFESMDTLLAEVSSGYQRPFGVKLPPYFDMAHFDEAAEILNRYPLVAFVTCINSIGNALVIDLASETTLIKPKDGFGGLGGDYVLPTALANVNAFYRRCPNKTIIGCGGIKSGREAFMHILAGATLVQIGTSLYEEGPGIFQRVLDELSAIMDEKGYATTEEFRGKLKTL
ncbi:dihydroorotate oxidase [Chitinibacter bivalviorum]|uniref:dihydroorotate oxidase (fumarate) n=1 Tax=Chitinibacter bivalviorum TaxID=2739434 RepID=A0A7H9BIB7_9NEIS|nr:dihydroorotate oxidase [Chitinibacter bivalviorum]QLG87948.1 dihydroorotate oxidase [Chitinibacter bivalviorum]